MLRTDRAEFESQLKTLCAGFNIPATTERQEAYWTGLAKMSLLQFVRCVEYVLSEDGPDKFPTTKAMWNIHKTARSRATQITQPVRLIEQQDHLLYFANRMFSRHLANRGGLGPTELSAARKVTRDLVDWFAGPVRENDPDATPAAFVQAYIKALQRVSRIDQRTLDGWADMAGHSDAKFPFAAYMGSELPAEQARLVE
jgi:hypothetical protein